MHLYPAAKRQTFLSVLTGQLPWDLLFSWREVFTREVFLQHWSEQTHGQRHEGSSPSTWAPVSLRYREEDERGCALLKHRTWPGFRKALKHMLKPSPFLRRDVFVTRAPSSTATGPVCRGAVGEQGNWVPLRSWSNRSFIPCSSGHAGAERCYCPLILSLGTGHIRMVFSFSQECPGTRRATFLVSNKVYASA